MIHCLINTTHNSQDKYYTNGCQRSQKTQSLPISRWMVDTGRFESPTDAANTCWVVSLVEFSFLLRGLLDPLCMVISVARSRRLRSCRPLRNANRPSRLFLLEDSTGFRLVLRWPSQQVIVRSLIPAWPPKL